MTTRSARCLLAGILCTAMLAGCGTMTKVEDWWRGGAGSKGGTLPEISAKVDARVLWQASVGASRDFAFTPAVAGGSVYAAAADGAIARFEAATGRQVWRIDAGQKLSGAVGGSGDLVLVGTQKGRVLAFDGNGKALWQAQVSSEILSAPKSDGKIVVVRSHDGRLFGLDAADGKRKWMYERATPALSLRSFAGAVLERGAVFAGFAGGKLVALEANSGTVGWEATVGQPRGTTELERIADVTSLPVSDNRNVYAVAYQGRAAAFDAASGNQVWVRDVSSYSGLAADARNVYVSDDKGAVVALDKSSGASVWKQDKLAGRTLSAPAVFGNYVVVGDQQGYVHVLSREDGALVGRVATDGGAVRATPEAEDKYVLVQTVNGGLFAITLK